MAVGAYSPAWRDIRLDPEEVINAPVCWAAGCCCPALVHVRAGPHPWAEPVDRLLVAAATKGVPVAVPRVGDRVDAAEPPALDPWWEKQRADDAAAHR